MSFLTEPNDIEPLVHIAEGVNTGDVVMMSCTCEEQGTVLVSVYDAEGEQVCIAPKPIADMLVKLINSDEWEGIKKRFG